LFSYFQGLFLACEHHSMKYQPILEEMIEMNDGGLVMDTNEMPLALEYYYYLHSHKRFHDILNIGQKCKPLLEEFLQVSDDAC
jgi:hypothetical protein